MVRAVTYHLRVALVAPAVREVQALLTVVILFPVTRLLATTVAMVGMVQVKVNASLKP